MSTQPTVDPFALQGEERWRLVAVSLLALAQAALTVPTLFVVRDLLDVGSHTRGESVTVGVLLAALVVAGVLMQRWARLQGLRVVERLVVRIRTALARRLASIGRQELAGRDIDRLHGDVVFATDRYERAAGSAIAGLLPSTIVVGVVGIVALVLSPPLALSLVVCSIPAVVLGRVQRVHVVESLRRFHRSLGRYSGAVWDAMGLRDLISAHGAERQVEGRLAAAGLETATTQHDAQRAQLSYSTWQHSIVGAAGAIALGVGAAFIGTHQARDLVMLVAAFGLIQASLRTVVGAIPLVLDGRNARSILEEFLSAGHEMVFADGAPVTGATWELQGVHFRYEGGDHDVLDGVDLRLEHGRITGIEGPNGSGKTTMVALILAWYEPTAGQILVDGVSMSTLDPATVRARIGLVPQEPEFMDATVRENLVLGLDPPPSEEAIAAALALSTADQSIAGRVAGLDEPMGRDGRKFSGGHRQRLAIARAVLREPALLIVDEPTNHLDPAAAKALLENLATCGKEWAVLVVSHDHAVLAMCDEVYRLDGGRLDANQSRRAEA